MFLVASCRGVGAIVPGNAGLTDRCKEGICAKRLCDFMSSADTDAETIPNAHAEAVPDSGSLADGFADADARCDADTCRDAYVRRNADTDACCKCFAHSDRRPFSRARADARRGVRVPSVTDAGERRKSGGRRRFLASSRD